LAAAGYPGGKGFPTVRLQVNNDGFGYVRVAEAVQTMIERELGIGLVISVLPADQHYQWIDEGHALMWRQGWVADYPDPENFLTLFLGQNAVLDTGLPSPLNTTRYHNARFDSLYMAARATTDPETRMNALALAEDQAMRDVTVAPLYHERTVRLLQPWVKGLPANAMDLRDVSRAWFDPALTKR
jgi:peptide/nickel transport system substrate-binding protein